MERIRTAISEYGACGLALVDVETRNTPCMSENLNARNEAVVQAELERYLQEAKAILFKHKEFLEKVQSVLMQKETLLYSDIREIRGSVPIMGAYI